jgi:hypothetical protein
VSETTTKSTKSFSPFTIKALLLPLLTHPKTAQIIKWSVYTLLTINFLIYFYDDFMAYKAAMPTDPVLGDYIEFFATTIDVAAWLGLVYLFEIETYILPDDAFEGFLPKLLIIFRIVCYLLIFSAAYGYTVATFGNYDTTRVENVSDLCDLADQGQSLQLDVIAYAEITSENCSDISTGPPFHQIGDDTSVIDGKTLSHVQKMGWLDIANSFSWLLIVFLIEVEIRLQATDRFGSRALKVARVVKTAFYGVLLFNVSVWAITSYALYAYDALLWIVGFWAIELNLAEWEQERTQELSETSGLA